MDLKTLAVALTLDPSQFKAGLGTAAGDVRKFGSEVEGAGGKVDSGLTKPLGLATTAAGLFAAKKIFDFGKAGFGEMSQAQEAMAVTEAHLKSTGAAAGVTADQITELSGRLSEMSGVDDEVIQGGENMLLTFTQVQNKVGDGNQIFDRATTAALDLSKSGFGSMESASVMLGKALNDPEKGLTALGRAGVQFTADQKATIQQMVATGDTLGAQKIILQEVEKQVGGTAAAYGDTLPGALDKAHNASDEMKAAILQGSSPALIVLADAATNAANFIAQLPAPLQAVIGALGLTTAGVLSIARPLATGIELWARYTERAAAAAAASATLAAAEEATAVAQASVATNSAASVAGLYATEGALASSGAAFGPWGIAVAAAIVTASAAWDIWGGKTEHNLDDISDLLGQTGKQLADSFLFTKWEGNPEDAGKMLEALAKGGDAGVGALKLLSAELKNEGQDASAVDAAIAGAVVSHENLNVAAAAGAAILSGDEEAMTAAGKAASGFGGFISDLAGAMGKTYDSMFTNVELTSSYEAAIDKLTDTLHKNGDTTDLTIEKGRENTASMIDMGQTISDLIQRRFEETHSVADATAAGDMYVQNLRDQLAAAGYNEEQIDSMIQTMNLTPEQIDTLFSSNAAEQQIVTGKYLALLDDIPPEKQTQIEALIAQGQYDSALALINDLTQPRTLTVHISTQGTVNIPDLGPGANREFHGSSSRWGDIYSFAAGGVTPAHVAHGDLIRYAEKETGGEAFIPRLGDPNRSRGVLNVAAGWYGMKVVPMMGGGFFSFDDGGLGMFAPESPEQRFADQAMKNQQQSEDVRFAVGDMSTAEYLAILQQRLAGTQQFSQEWYALWQKITSITESENKKQTDAMQQAADDQAKVAREHMEAHDNQFAAGLMSAEEYRAILEKRLAAAELYSDEWLRITQQIARIDQDAATEQKRLADEESKRQEDAARAKQDAADHQLELLRNEVKYGVASNEQLIAVLRERQSHLEMYSDAWVQLDEEIKGLVGGAGKVVVGRIHAPPVYDPKTRSFVDSGVVTEVYADGSTSEVSTSVAQPATPAATSAGAGDPYVAAIAGARAAMAGQPGQGWGGGYLGDRNVIDDLNRRLSGPHGDPNVITDLNERLADGVISKMTDLMHAFQATPPIVNKIQVLVQSRDPGTTISFPGMTERMMTTVQQALV